MRTRTMPPFPGCLHGHEGKAVAIASFGWSPSPPHELSSTTQTVKPGLKILKCLEPQKQKGGLDKRRGSP